MRVYFHGDDVGDPMQIPPYDPPRMDVPTFFADTTGDDSPDVVTLLREILAAV